MFTASACYLDDVITRLVEGMTDISFHVIYQLRATVVHFFFPVYIFSFPTIPLLPAI